MNFFSIYGNPFSACQRNNCLQTVPDNLLKRGNLKLGKYPVKRCSVRHMTGKKRYLRFYALLIILAPFLHCKITGMTTAQSKNGERQKRWQIMPFALFTPM